MADHADYADYLTLVWLIAPLVRPKKRGDGDDVIHRLAGAGAGRKAPQAGIDDLLVALDRELLECLLRVIDGEAGSDRKDRP